jgi:Family of unknown function (DUF6294)
MKALPIRSAPKIRRLKVKNTAVKKSKKRARSKTFAITGVKTNKSTGEWTSFTFPEIRRGDCKIFAGAKFTLHSDGSASWECDIMSTDTGDEWRGTFRFYTASNADLGMSAAMHYDIRHNNVKKHWTESFGANPSWKSKYPEVASCIFTKCDC